MNNKKTRRGFVQDKYALGKHILISYKYWIDEGYTYLPHGHQKGYEVTVHRGWHYYSESAPTWKNALTKIRNRPQHHIYLEVKWANTHSVNSLFKSVYSDTVIKLLP